MADQHRVTEIAQMDLDAYKAQAARARKRGGTMLVVPVELLSIIAEIERRRKAVPCGCVGSSPSEKCSICDGSGVDCNG